MHIRASCETRRASFRANSDEGLCVVRCWTFSDRSAGAPNRLDLGVKQTCRGHARRV